METRGAKSAQSAWQEAQRWEQSWWGACQNTYGEEEKQLLYALKMGLVAFHDGKSPYNFDLRGASVLDVGGGPVSLLLKCENVRGKVVDPTRFPDWVYARYDSAGIEWEINKGEDINETGYAEAWIYNTLQHVDDPQHIIANAQRATKLIRIFEWLGISDNAGHLHALTREQLDRWLGGEGRVERLAEHGCYGTAYYGIFLTKTD